MYKVGDFSKISRVSVKALRYYDERELLKPVRVDEETGYRYYHVDQLPRLNRILALKELGLSLEQISVILNEQLSSLEIRGMLRLKRAELRQEVQETQMRLSLVERRLKQIEQEDTLLSYDIVIKNVASQLIASAREVVLSPDAIAERCILLTNTIVNTLSQTEVKATGPWGTIYHGITDELYTQKPTDIEVVVVLDPSFVKTYTPRATSTSWNHEQVVIRELAGCPSMACLVHTNDYQGLWDAYAAMLLWIATNGYQIIGPCRIFYLHMVPANRHPVSEIQIPVEKVVSDAHL